MRRFALGLEVLISLTNLRNGEKPSGIIEADLGVYSSSASSRCAIAEAEAVLNWVSIFICIGLGRVGEMLLLPGDIVSGDVLRGDTGPLVGICNGRCLGAVV